VLVLALRAGVPPLSVGPLAAALQVLERSGSRVEVVHPDDVTQAAFASASGVLDPSVREPAAKAGRRQGRRIGRERIAPFWNE
jgi:NTE family protein